jgi:hypothetical protein
MKEDEENTNRGLAAAFTFGYHGILFVIIFFIVLKTPIPPFPDHLGGSGLEVNFGNSETGFGDNLSEELLDVETTPVAGNPTDNYLTQDNETTPTITATTNPTKTTEPVIKINDPVINTKAIYKKKNTSQGIAGGTGNQGKPGGDVNSNNYTGNGGTGGTTGTGTGTGVGPNTGPGVSSVDLKDRKTLYLPPPTYDSGEEGVVVVSITVDVNGNVIKAVPGAKGTNISKKSYWDNSKAAAMKAKFNAKKDAAVEQKGTITYVFLKQN